MRGPGVLAVLLFALAAAAQPAAARFPQTPPDDPLFDASPLPNATNEQWDLAAPAGGFDRGISAAAAWPLSTGAGTILAEVDVGMQTDHPDLRHQALRGWDFYGNDANTGSDTRNAHGTNVAGVLAAQADNGIGIAGTAPGARLLPLRTQDNILHRASRVGEAIVYATDRHADAISMSLGLDNFGPPVRRAVRYAHRHGVIMAVASGNEFHFHHHYPQVMDDVLAVGGVNPDTANLAARDQRLALAAHDFTVHASYSDYGPHLDLVAPVQVETTEIGGGYRNVWDGTSAATPHVAATAALVISRGRRLGLHLTADEVIQILRMSADDLSSAADGFAPGWDLRSGWGRVNALHAVQMAAPGKVPPDANITAPDWYEPIRRGTIAVRGIASGRRAVTWTLELGRGEQPSTWRTIATGHGAAAVARRDRLGAAARPRLLARVDARRLAAGGWTLRLRARDAAGRRSEDREFFYVLRDPALKRGYPRALGTSGEASPTLADVNGDRRPDIVLPAADGLVRVLDGRTGRELPGWPQRMRASTGFGARVAARSIGLVREGFLATAAVGDVWGDRRPEVVAAGMDGRVYAWTARGRPLRGFPAHIRLHGIAEQGRLESAIFATPALADLSCGPPARHPASPSRAAHESSGCDGKQDIVVGAADQRIYALRGNGRAVPGWPVLARDAAGGDAEKILSSPAIGDLDGDGHPDVVEGTAETYGTTPDMSGRVYAFDRHGHPLPGWPVAPGGLVTNGIPLAGQGVPDSPSLADVDGDGRDEVAVAAFTGAPELYRGDGTRMTGANGGFFQTATHGPGSDASDTSVLALGANGAFGKLSPGGPLSFFGGVVDSRLAAAQLSPGTAIPFEHLLGGWDVRGGGAWLPAFPRVMEGWQVADAPAIADVDGDGRAEVLAGSSGDVLHAFRADGTEPAGWPKDTGGWLLASPAVGDIDGDGRLEVVAVTRDGWLYVWDTPARARPGTLQWPSFRHDPENTGRYR